MVINKNANVTVIPARYHAMSQEKDEGKPKLRVAAYCRVSTDSEEQATSYEAQHRSNIIRNIYRKIPNGSWPGYLRMKAFPALTPANAGSLTA